MRWRSDKAVVVRRADDYFVFTPAGVLQKHLKPSRYSDEDDLWITVHLVEHGTLITRTRIEGPYAPRDAREEVIVEGLVPFDDAELAARWLSEVDAADALAVRREEDAADARVAAISGALDELNLGPDAARAQHALINRIRSNRDTRCAGLLATLIKFAKVKPGEAATAAFVRGCLLASYANEVPPVSTGGVKTPHPALAAEVLAHAKVCADDALAQEWADARNDAATLSRAADSMQRAASLLSA